MIENTQKTIDLENSNEILIKEKDDFENEKNNLTKNLIKVNEHNKHLSKELKEEKFRKLEDAKNLTDQLNEKQLEINKLQSDIEILTRNLEISNFQASKLQDFDLLLEEVQRKTKELEESERNYSDLQEKVMVLQKTTNGNVGSFENNEELAQKNQRIHELENLLEQHQNIERFVNQYKELLVILIILFAIFMFF